MKKLGADSDVIVTFDRYSSISGSKGLLDKLHEAGGVNELALIKNLDTAGETIENLSTHFGALGTTGRVSPSGEIDVVTNLGVYEAKSKINALGREELVRQLIRLKKFADTAGKKAMVAVPSAMSIKDTKLRAVESVLGPNSIVRF